MDTNVVIKAAWVQISALPISLLGTLDKSPHPSEPSFSPAWNADNNARLTDVFWRINWVKWCMWKRLLRRTMLNAWRGLLFSAYTHRKKTRVFRSRWTQSKTGNKCFFLVISSCGNSNLMGLFVFNEPHPVSSFCMALRRSKLALSSGVLQVSVRLMFNLPQSLPTGYKM